jgi:hypothetical protein
MARFFCNIVLSTAAAIVLGLMVYICGDRRTDPRLLLFAIWATLPYGMLILIINRSTAFKNHRTAKLIGGLFSVSTLLITLFVYINALFINTSSTSGLVFLGGPCWLLLAPVGLILVLCTFPQARELGGGLCSKCGYNLTGNASGVCPECGISISEEQPVKLM